MKMIRLILFLSLIVNGYFFWSTFAGREKWVGQYKVKTIGRFSIMTNSREKDSYIIAYDNAAASWTIDGNKQSINVWKVADYSIWLNDKKSKISKTLFQYADSQGKTVYYSDFNGDGVVDARLWVDPNKSQYFIGGQFYDAENTNGKQYVIMNGKTNEVVFQNGHWNVKQ